MIKVRVSVRVKVDLWFIVKKDVYLNMLKLNI